MNVFSFFKRNAPTDIYEEIAEDIVGVALYISAEFEKSDSQILANIGAEIAFVLLHVADRESFKLFGPAKRNEIYDNLYKRVIAKYCDAILRQDVDLKTKESIALDFLDTLNERQQTYSKCKTVFGNPFPSIGTIVFALSYFIHKAMGKTNRKDVDDILSGERKLEQKDMQDFPNTDQDIKVNIYFGNAISSMKMPKKLKKLK